MPNDMDDVISIIEKFSAAELEKLIVDLSERRAKMAEQFPSDPPKGPVQCILNLQWFVQDVPEGTLLQIKHTGFGWLSFILPPAERAHLATAILHQALVHNNTDQSAVTVPSVPIVTGGGTLH